MELFSTKMEIESVHLQRDRVAILTSNLTGNIWNGQIILAHFDGNAMTQTQTLFSNTGIPTGLWHGGKLYLGTDEGCVQVYSAELALLCSAQTNHSSIRSLSKKGKNLLVSDSNQFLLFDENLALQKDFLERGVEASAFLDDNTCLVVKGNLVLSVKIDSGEKTIICQLTQKCSKLVLFESNFVVCGEGSIFIVNTDGTGCVEIAIEGIASCISQFHENILVGTETGFLVKIDLKTRESTRVKVHDDKVTSITCSKETILTSSLDKKVKIHSF